MMSGKGILTQVFCLVIAAASISAQEAEQLKPTLEIKELGSVPEYYGLETKWSVEQKMGAGLAAKVTFMNLDVFLAYVENTALAKGYSDQEKQEKREEVMAILRNNLVFKVFLYHEKSGEYTKIKDWHLALFDDRGKRYQPANVEQGEAVLTRGYSSPYYSRTCWVYFPRTQQPGGEPILSEQTKWIKLRFSKGLKHIDFAWMFTKTREEKSATFFYPYVKAALTAVLVALVVAVWITRPGRAIRALNKSDQTSLGKPRK